MSLPSLPLVHPTDTAQSRPVSTSGWRRLAESINNILNFNFDDSRIRTAAEIAAAVTPVDYAYPPGDDRRYGCVGDGVTDDTVALSNLIKVAIASPGLRCYLRALTYAVSATLPTINVGNVLILGAGWMRHDLGSSYTGTTIKWIGSSTSTPILTISSVSGGSNQKIGGIVFWGIGFDCNQLAQTGLSVQSVFSSWFWVGINESTLAGVKIGVVASLGEAPDTQDCRFILSGTQLFQTTATLLQLTCSVTANVSLNHFWCDYYHTGVRAIDLQGSDNNDWWYVRCFKPGGGAATESVSVEGGASSTQCARAERFHYLVATVPMHVYATGYTTAAHDIMCYVDKENGTPDLIIDTGATAYQQSSTTPVFDAPHQSYSPVVTASSGTFTAVSATGGFLRRGKITFFQFQVTCTTLGSAAGSMKVTLPAAESSPITSSGAVVTGFNTTTAALCSGLITTGASLVLVNKYDGTFPIASGQAVIVSGFYATA